MAIDHFEFGFSKIPGLGDEVADLRADFLDLQIGAFAAANVNPDGGGGGIDVIDLRQEVTTAIAGIDDFILSIDLLAAPGPSTPTDDGAGIL